MAMTTRLPDALKAEAQAYGETLGLSLNAMLALALREYLDTRRPPAGSSGASAAPRRPSAPSEQLAPPPPASTPFKPPATRSAPCPCGAKTVEGYPIKWKHCHGQTQA